MADSSVLEVALDADNNVWWTIIDAADFWSLVLLACEKITVVFVLVYRHLELDETNTWKLEPSSRRVLNVSCTL